MFERVTGENKAVICEHLYGGRGDGNIRNGVTTCVDSGESSQNALQVLERWRDSDKFSQREVGFCAQWCLDNLCKNRRVYCQFVIPVFTDKVFCVLI